MSKQELKTETRVTEIRNDKGKVIRRRVQTFNYDDSMTQQQFADDVDANKVIKKYGMENPLYFKRQDGYYADLTSVPDLSTALQTVKQAEEAFASLPSEARERFGNSPELMIKFLGDENNRQEAIDLGLLVRPEPEAPPIRVVVDNPPEQKQQDVK